jgi:hypothetical protein
MAVRYIEEPSGVDTPPPDRLPSFRQADEKEDL